MNQHIIIGNLTRDPEKGTTESGVNWCRFVVAVNKRHKKEGEPDADFIRVTAWRGLADTCAQYLTKGRKVCVVGVPQASAWIGQDGKAKCQLELTADNVEFLSPGRKDQPTDADAPEQRDPQTGMQVVSNDEAPW